VLRQLATSLDTIRTAQAADSTLSNLMKALSGGGTIPTSVAPGFKHAFLQDGVLCRPFQSSSSSSCHTQIVIPSSLQSTFYNNFMTTQAIWGNKRQLRWLKSVIVGLDMKEMWESGSKNVGNVSEKNPPHQAQKAPLDTIQSTSPFEKTFLGYNGTFITIF